MSSKAPTLKRIDAGVLEIGYFEAGPAKGMPTILLHGFPYDPHAYDAAAEQLAAAGLRVIVPYLRGYGPTRFRSPETPRSGEQAALGADLLALMDALDIPRALLGGYDWGGRAACIVAALWPERVAGLVSCGTGYNIQNIAEAWRPAPPSAEHRFWYQYYFHSERGRLGLSENRRELCRLIWQLWSPSWAFDGATFERSAVSFDNPDFVDVVVHSYRHRFGGVPGDPALLPIEARLAQQPQIEVPTIVLQGADDGVDPPETDDESAPYFSGCYARRIIPAVGHNLPQEAPAAFAEAVLALA
ncbi:Pimeloyl-ACP methyl ester carboxylesterase [Kaistia soli DSM 19436]|uniref:Pimeloyl-ACP methyl ester carboxylesterase n=1 Tax=Kaistia soli DSM 19436 TaxID=1122133 RepID=A0A1M5A902_9HYPH|nr:alpha/beta hydrolase [Kaistia soli]SHF26743.1 Pimeloyl-ACP methyl ester carboxylesterase [Kaistia soli DSM 19436]